jgi:hypothetical protein
MLAIVKQINTMAFQPYVSLLGPYHVSTILRRTHKPPPPIVVNDEHKYEVQEIFNSMISHL